MYRVDILNKGDSRFEVKSKDYEFTVDTKGKGITPPDTFLASLGTCIGVYTRKYFEGAKIPLTEFSVSVEAEFSEEAPICFRKVNVNIDLKDAVIDGRRKEALLTFIKNCPIHNTCKSNPEIAVEVTRRGP